MPRIPLLAAIGLCFALIPAFAQAAVIDADCTGTPYFNIQQAVTASNPGDVIVVHPDCANFPQAINIVGLNNLQIVGAEEPVYNYTGAYPVGPNQWPPGNPVIYDFGQSCIHIQNSNDISIASLLFEYCIDDGVTILNSNRITIQGLGIYAVGADGIAVRGSRDINISGNFLFGATFNNSSGIVVDASSDLVRIQNNRITKNINGIIMEGSRVHVLNNDVSANADVGIIVRSDQSTVTRNTVLNNASGVEIDFTAMPPDTCVVGNTTNNGIVPWATGCQGSNN